MKPNAFVSAGLAFIICCISFTGFADDSTGVPKHHPHPKPAPELKLPDGFTATPVVEGLGNNRHIVVNAKGDLYIKLGNAKGGKGILLVHPGTNGEKAKVIQSFGDYGGTGIAISNGYLYATSNDDVYRYKLDENGQVSNPDAPEKIVTGLVNKRQHSSKSITLDNAGNIYVTVGAPSNSCQLQDRTEGSPGQDPCPILEHAGGIWQFKADKQNQTYADGIHYATGLRNVVGLDWNDKANALYAMQHGRDDLHRMFPKLFSDETSAEVPAEEMFLVKKGSNFGWPYCYFDPQQNKKVLAPEYGGDGKKQDRCAEMGQPLIAFPGHWAPNAMLFYTGDMFPERYKNGVFIAFHGSWNRAPLPQKGYNVVFVPFENGKPSGKYEVFADGFKGADEIQSPGQAEYRPCGLAQGPDGSLYISDDRKGEVWKITYNK